MTRGKDPNPNDLDGSFIELDEFLTFMVAMRRYIELYAAFEDIDEGKDHRINFSVPSLSFIECSKEYIFV